MTLKPTNPVRALQEAKIKKYDTIYDCHGDGIDGCDSYIDELPNGKYYLASDVDAMIKKLTAERDAAMEKLTAPWFGVNEKLKADLDAANAKIAAMLKAVEPCEDYPHEHVSLAATHAHIKAIAEEEG